MSQKHKNLIADDENIKINLIWPCWYGKLSIVFSSPDSKGHVSYCHHWASVVRLLTFHILINSSEAPVLV
jgi:hypothetical protein